jgi:hypothetical protein
MGDGQNSLKIRLSIELKIYESILSLDSSFNLCGLSFIKNNDLKDAFLW